MRVTRAARMAAVSSRPTLLAFISAKCVDDDAPERAILHDRERVQSRQRVGRQASGKLRICADGLAVKTGWRTPDGSSPSISHATIVAELRNGNNGQERNWVMVIIPRSRTCPLRFPSQVCKTGQPGIQRVGYSPTVMSKIDEDAARRLNRPSGSQRLDELHAETQRLYDEITMRTQRNRANNALLKPTRRAKNPRRT